MASKEIRVEVNDDKTKYMVMSRDQNARRSYRLTFKNRASIYRTGVPLPSRCCILYIFFNKYKY